MTKKSSDTAPRWASPYVTRSQLVKAGLASRATLEREQARGALVPHGRRGGRGPYIYRVADVDRWLAGDVPAAAAAAPPRPAPAIGVQRAAADIASAVERIKRTSGGRP